MIKMYRTSSERLMYIQFTYCVYGEMGIRQIFTQFAQIQLAQFFRLIWAVSKLSQIALPYELAPFLCI